MLLLRFSDKEEVPGSSPGSPTGHLAADQRGSVEPIPQDTRLSATDAGAAATRPDTARLCDAVRANPGVNDEGQRVEVATRPRHPERRSRPRHRSSPCATVDPTRPSTSPSACSGPSPAACSGPLPAACSGPLPAACSATLLAVSGRSRCRRHSASPERSSPDRDLRCAGGRSSSSLSGSRLHRRLSWNAWPRRSVGCPRPDLRPHVRPDVLEVLRAGMIALAWDARAWERVRSGFLCLAGTRDRLHPRGPAQIPVGAALGCLPVAGCTRPPLGLDLARGGKLDPRPELPGQVVDVRLRLACAAVALIQQD